jgi:LuxR family transcriptional regulator, maltose regulon positive regulatory protein
MDTQHPVEIRALGSLQLTTGGSPLVVGNRRVKRPLDLLRALIAAGPQGATRDELCEAVWEAPLAVAYRPLVTTVFRLRRLLQDKQAVVFNERRISLDASRCWVDAWAFDAALRTAAASGQEILATLALYRGALFEGQFAHYIGPARERYCAMFVAATLQAGQELVAAGSLAAAQEHYERALQHECRSEELFRALIEVLRRRGLAAAAIIAYNTCAVAMRRYHGRLPTPETRAAWEAAARMAGQGEIDDNLEVAAPPAARAPTAASVN